MRQSIEEEQREFIADFNELEDWLIQYNALLEITSRMEPLRAEEKVNSNRVYTCKAKLWLIMEHRNGKVYLRADSESLIVKGIVGVIVALLNDRTPREIRKADIRFIDETNIAQQISTDRYQGMYTIIHKIKQFADKYL